MENFAREFALFFCLLVCIQQILTFEHIFRSIVKNCPDVKRWYSYQKNADKRAAEAAAKAAKAARAARNKKTKNATAEEGEEMEEGDEEDGNGNV